MKLSSFSAAPLILGMLLWTGLIFFPGILFGYRQPDRRFVEKVAIPAF